MGNLFFWTNFCLYLYMLALSWVAKQCPTLTLTENRHTTSNLNNCCCPQLSQINVPCCFSIYQRMSRDLFIGPALKHIHFPSSSGPALVLESTPHAGHIWGVVLPKTLRETWFPNGQFKWLHSWPCSQTGRWEERFVAPTPTPPDSGNEIFCWSRAGTELPRSKCVLLNWKATLDGVPTYPKPKSERDRMQTRTSRMAHRQTSLSWTHVTLYFFLVPRSCW